MVLSANSLYLGLNIVSLGSIRFIDKTGYYDFQIGSFVFVYKVFFGKAKNPNFYLVGLAPTSAAVTKIHEATVVDKSLLCSDILPDSAHFSSQKPVPCLANFLERFKIFRLLVTGRHFDFFPKTIRVRMIPLPVGINILEYLGHYSCPKINLS